MTPDTSLSQARETLVRKRRDIDDAIRALDRVMASEPEPVSTKAATATGSKPPHGLASQRGARTDAAEQIIVERAGKGLKPAELAEALAERGVPLRSDNPSRAGRAVGDRVRERNPNVSLENGRFVYHPSNGAGGSRPEAFQLPVPDQEKAQ